jgi:hypothetical protein
MARNKYPGECYRCGKNVPAGAGHFEKVKGGPAKWRVQHVECAIRMRREIAKYRMCNDSVRGPIKTTWKDE